MNRINRAARWLNDFAEDGLAPLKNWIEEVGVGVVIGVLSVMLLAAILAMSVTELIASLPEGRP